MGQPDCCSLKNGFWDLLARRISPRFLFLKPNPLVDGMMVQSINFNMLNPQNQDTSLLWSLTTLGHYHPGVMCYVLLSAIYARFKPHEKIDDIFS